MATKRLGSIPGLIQVHKRPKIASTETEVVPVGIRRTSSLCAPVIRLADHEGEINVCKFHPSGNLVMSSGSERKIHISCNYGVNGITMCIIGHTATVMDAQFSSDGASVFSCSLDETLAVWNTATGEKITSLNGHESCVNTVSSYQGSSSLLCSGSDDRTVRLWDIRENRFPCQTFQSGHAVTSTCFNNRGDHIISGGVDNDVKIWDIRKNGVVGRLQAHIDVISGISLSPCGLYLLSNSLDNTLRIWDLRPFSTGDRCVSVYEANQYVNEANLLRCAWSKDGKKIAAGSSDYHVYIWDIVNHRRLYKLPGHESSVHDVDFHPTEPIIVSGSRCENLFMHEFDQ